MLKINVEIYEKTVFIQLQYMKRIINQLKSYNMQVRLGIKNMSDLTIKAIQSFQNTNDDFCNVNDDLTGTYIRENLALPIIIDCRTSAVVEFKSKLGFKQHDIIMTIEQSVIRKLMKVSCGKEKILLQHSDLGRRMDLYIPEHKLAKEIDEKAHKDRIEKKEIARQKVTEELHYKFIRTNPDEKDFDIYVEIGKIYNHITESTRKPLIDTISAKYYYN